MNTNYIAVVEQSDEEKLAMYMKLPQEEVCRMLLTANRYLDSIPPKITHVESDQLILPCSCSHAAVMFFKSEELYVSLYVRQERSIWQRIRTALTMIFKGDTEFQDIILSREDTDRLTSYLNKNANV